MTDAAMLHSLQHPPRLTNTLFTRRKTSMPDDTPKSVSRPTMLPERPQTPAAPLPAVPVARVQTPPDGTPSQRPAATPRTWPEVVDAAIDKITRRGLRGGVALLIFKLQLARAASPEALIAMGGCAVGLEAAVRAAKERRAATVAAVAIPLAMAAAGHLFDVELLTHAGVYIAALGLPFASYLSAPTSA